MGHRLASKIIAAQFWAHLSHKFSSTHKYNTRSTPPPLEIAFLSLLSEGLLLTNSKIPKVSLKRTNGNIYMRKKINKNGVLFLPNVEKGHISLKNVT